MTYPYSGKRPDYHPKVVTALPYYSLLCYEVRNLTSFLPLCGPFPFEYIHNLIVVGESKVVTCGSGTEGWIPNVRKSVRCTGSMFTPSLPEGMRYMESTIDGSPTKAFSRSIFTVTAGEDTGYLYISCKRLLPLFLWNSELGTHEAGMRCSNADYLQGSHLHAHSLRCGLRC